MTIEVRLPKMGTSMVEAIVERWLKAEGETVREGDDLVEVMTDKVNAVVPAPADGVLRRIVVAPDETVAVGTVLAYIEPASTRRD